MSKIALTPNASGTGTFTLAAPNSNTSRTITLPDEAGEVLVNGTNQNVGIGTSSPAAELHIAQSGGTPEIRLSDGTNAAMFKMDTVAHIGSVTSVGLAFDINSTEEMRLTSTGLGIGTTSPTADLHFYNSGDNLVETIMDTNRAGAGSTIGRNRFYWNGTEVAKIEALTGSDTTNKDDGQLRFLTRPSGSALAEAMRIDSSGNVGIGTSSPSTTLHVYDAGSGGDGTVHIGGTSSAATGQLFYEVSGSTYLRLRNTYRSTNANAYMEFDAGYHRFLTGTGGSEAMRIDSSGRVKIGTTSNTPAGDGVAGFVFGDNTAGTPATGIASFAANSSAPLLLTRLGSDGNVLGIADGTTTRGLLRVVSSNLAIQGNNNLVFSTGGSNAERMRIDGSGRLLVGNTGYNIGQDGVYLQAAGSVFSRNTTGSSTQINFGNPNGVVGTITTNGSSTSYNTSSDYRLKTDAQPMTGASARVQALNPVNFEWIADGTRVDGFLAHEAQEVVPEAVTGTKDAMRDEEYEVTPAVYEDVVIPAVLDEDGNELEAERTEQQLVTEAVMGTRSVPDYQGIDQSKLVPLLTAALQEALTEISDLKARVTALEAV